MKYDTICLSGGGIFGFTFIGAINELINNNLLDINNITNWIGTSAGAVVSFIFALGYNIDEILDFIENFNFNILLPKKYKLFTIFNTNALNNGNKFVIFFKKFIFKKYNIDDLTFEQLYELSRKKLIIIGTNFTKNTEEVFSLENTPNMSIITAVRISMSIPIIFSPILYNNCYYMDGSIKNNFPYNYCNPNTTLGICINKKYINNNINNILNIFKISISMILNNVIKYNNKNIIYINYINDYNNIIYNDIDLSNENINKMILHGKNSIINFINDNNNDNNDNNNVNNNINDNNINDNNNVNNVNVNDNNDNNDVNNVNDKFIQTDYILTNISTQTDILIQTDISTQTDN